MSTAPVSSTTEVAFEYTGNLPALLAELRASVVLSTYQAGKLIVVGTHAGQLQLRFHHFEQAMGIARTPTGLAVGTRRQVWTLAGAPDLAPRIPPAGTHDLALLTRSAVFTGPIMGHDLAWVEGELWVTNTLFSCLSVLHPQYSFVPRWRPPFISALVAEDRCHLNGLAADATGPRFVTCLGETDTPAGWRANKASGGCLVEVGTGEVLVRGLSMPHSPRLNGGDLWVLDSGRGKVCRYDPTARRLDPVAEVPGYGRGMDLIGQYAFVGLSRIRETNVFGGLPITERRADLKCGLAVVDLNAGRVVASLYFGSGVEEVFEVKVMPGYLNPFVSGPLPDTDGTETLWLVPNPV